MVIANGFVSPDKAVTKKSAGHDFLAFYTAGTFVRRGRSAELYNLKATGAFEQEIARQQQLELPAGVIGPYWNPSFFAWVFVPLSKLPYPTAWNVWFAINIACLAGAIALLMRMLPGDWRTRGLVPLLIITAPPLIQALGHGQNTCVSLLLLCMTVTLWRGNRAILAGIACGLLFYKPQLGAILALAMVINLGWKPLAGLAMTGTTLLAITLITLPGTLGAFLRQLPHNITYMQIEHRYMWDRHVTLEAFWRLLLQGFALGELWPVTRILYLASVIALAALLLITIWKLRGTTAARDRVIAATIVTMPLLMPFYFDYDLLLLAAAAVLYARSMGVPPMISNTKNHGRDAHATLIFTNWIVLFLWTAINPGISNMTHVNVSVLLLTTLSVMLIAGPGWQSRKRWRLQAKMEIRLRFHKRNPRHGRTMRRHSMRPFSRADQRFTRSDP